MTSDGLVLVQWYTDGSKSSLPPTQLLSEGVVFGDAFDEVEEVESDFEDSEVEGMEESGAESWETEEESEHEMIVNEQHIPEENLTSAEDLAREKEMVEKLVNLVKEENIDNIEEENNALVDANQERVTTINSVFEISVGFSTCRWSVRS